MSIAAVSGAPRLELNTTGMVGAGAGLAIGAGVAAATAKTLSFPLPVALVAGGVIGGPIAAVSLMNNTGKPNNAWQSAAIGAGPLAVVGGALGAVGTAFDGGKLGIGIAAGALTFGLVGAGIGAITHAVTKPD